MSSTFQTRFKPLLLAGLLATAGFSAFAQTPPAAPADGQPRAHRGMRHDQRDPAKMQQFMAKREAELKARLKIEPSQEGAWTAFTTAMKPPADMRQRREAIRAEMQKLTTPERIDRMKALRAERAAGMEKRGDAVKAFYAVLNADQKKVFDSRPMMGRGGPPHGRMHGGMGGHDTHHGQMSGQTDGHQPGSDRS